MVTIIGNTIQMFWKNIKNDHWFFHSPKHFVQNINCFQTTFSNRLLNNSDQSVKYICIHKIQLVQELNLGNLPFQSFGLLINSILPLFSNQLLFINEAYFSMFKTAISSASPKKRVQSTWIRQLQLRKLKPICTKSNLNLPKIQRQ